MVRHFQKDMRLAEQTASEIGVTIPVATLVAQLYRSLQAEGLEAQSQGHHALIKVIESLSNTEARG